MEWKLAIKLLARETGDLHQVAKELVLKIPERDRLTILARVLVEEAAEYKREQTRRLEDVATVSR